MHSVLYQRGIELFNRGEFFDAHETLEDVWRESVGRERLFLQGLIQVAVALHHHSRGNLAGARSLLKRAARNLDGYPDHYLGLNLPSLHRSLLEWQHALGSGGPPPSLPRLEIRAGEGGPLPG